jgi:hypothetical protein
MSRNKLTEIREAREAALKAEEAIRFADFIKLHYNITLTPQGYLWYSHEEAEFKDSASIYVEFKKKNRKHKP